MSEILSNWNGWCTFLLLFALLMFGIVFSGKSDDVVHGVLDTADDIKDRVRNGFYSSAGKETTRLDGQSFYNNLEPGQHRYSAEISTKFDNAIWRFDNRWIAAKTQKEATQFAEGEMFKQFPKSDGWKEHTLRVIQVGDPSHWQTEE